VSKIHSEIKQLNATIQSMKLSKHLPIGTSDAGSVMSTTLGAGIDYFMANVHPYFGGLAIADAAKWTWDFFQEFDVAPAQASANKPAVYIAEVGWPSQSMNASAANSGAGSPQGDASVANLQSESDVLAGDHS
jgi:glucan 1,3-beta-glucosidase